MSVVSFFAAYLPKEENIFRVENPMTGLECELTPEEDGVIYMSSNSGEKLFCNNELIYTVDENDFTYYELVFKEQKIIIMGENVVEGGIDFNGKYFITNTLNGRTMEFEKNAEYVSKNVALAAIKYLLDDYNTEYHYVVDLDDNFASLHFSNTYIGNSRARLDGQDLKISLIDLESDIWSIVVNRMNK